MDGVPGPADRSAQPWLRVFQLPSCAPDLNPLAGIWSCLKRGPLASLAFTGFPRMRRPSRPACAKSGTSPASSRGASPEPDSASNKTTRHHELKVVSTAAANRAVTWNSTARPEGARTISGSVCTAPCQ
jgi:hypothetical protein